MWILTLVLLCYKLHTTCSAEEAWDKSMSHQEQEPMTKTILTRCVLYAVVAVVGERETPSLDCVCSICLKRKNHNDLLDMRVVKCCLKAGVAVRV